METYLRIGKVNKIGNGIDKLGLDGLLNCKYPLKPAERNERLSRGSRLSRDTSKHQIDEIGRNKPTGNAFHVAIQSKQSATIKLIMERILTQLKKELVEEKRNAKDALKTLKMALGDKVHDKRINSSHSSLNGMNAIHLACVYHPRAVTEIGDLIEAWL